MNPYIQQELLGKGDAALQATISYRTEIDEFWRFVGRKSNQRWTWYAMENKAGKILAWHNGKRSDKDFLSLLWLP